MGTLNPKVHSRIVCTPNTAGGLPRVIGTGITVERLCRLREDGMTADQVVKMLPELDLEDVWSAWSYAHHHRMDRAFARRKAS